MSVGPSAGKSGAVTEREGAAGMSSKADRHDGSAGGDGTLLGARAIAKHFAGVTALEAVDFDLRAGRSTR